MDVHQLSRFYDSYGGNVVGPFDLYNLVSDPSMVATLSNFLTTVMNNGYPHTTGNVVFVSRTIRVDYGLVFICCVVSIYIPSRPIFSNVSIGLFQPIQGVVNSRTTDGLIRLIAVFFRDFVILVCQ